MSTLIHSFVVGRVYKQPPLAQKRSAAFVLRYSLATDVRHERHEPRALDGTGEVTLSFGRKACALATIHPSVRVDIVGETNDVFVVDMFDSYFFV